MQLVDVPVVEDGEVVGSRVGSGGVGSRKKNARE